MGIGAKIFFPFKFIIAAIGVTAIALTICITALPVFTLRFIVELLAKIFRRDLVCILKPRQVILADDRVYTHPGFNINLINFFDNDVDLKTILEKMQERLFPPRKSENSESEYEYQGLRYTLTSFCGYWFWKKIDNFHLQDYVHLYEDCIPPGDQGSSAPPIREEYNEDDLKHISDYLITKPWRKNHGLWEIIILRNYKPTSSAKIQTVFIVHFHHCTGDGYSWLRFVSVISNHDGEAAALATTNRKKHNMFLKVIAPVFIPVKAFYDLTLYLAKLQWDSNDWINRPKDPSTKGFLTTWTEPIAVERLKTLKRKFGVSFLAVVTGICAGAFRKMMIETDAKVPKILSCFIPLPLPNHRGGLRVHAGGTMLKLYTGEADGVKRVFRTHRMIQREIRSMAPLILHKVVTYGGYLPRVILKRIVAPRMTVAMTPFVGMAAPCRFTPEHVCHRSLFTLGTPPDLCPVVAGIATLSHAGNITFAFICLDHICESRKQLEQFSRFVNEELQLLEEAASLDIIVQLMTKGSA